MTVFTTSGKEVFRMDQHGNVSTASPPPRLSLAHVPSVCYLATLSNVPHFFFKRKTLRQIQDDLPIAICQSYVSVGDNISLEDAESWVRRIMTLRGPDTPGVTKSANMDQPKPGKLSGTFS